MDTIYLAVGYLRMQARRLGRSTFHNDVGALTLEWIVIAVALVGAAIAAGVFIAKKVKGEEHKITVP